jgi:hypothetical protein
MDGVVFACGEAGLAYPRRLVVFFSRPIAEKKFAMTGRSADSLEGSETLRATGNIQRHPPSHTSAIEQFHHPVLDQTREASCITQRIGLPSFMVL